MASLPAATGICGLWTGQELAEGGIVWLPALGIRWDCHTGIQRYQLGFPWKPSFGFYGDILLERGHISPTTVGSRLSDDVRPCDSRESGQMSDEGVSLQKVPT